MKCHSSHDTNKEKILLSFIRAKKTQNSSAILTPSLSLFSHFPLS